MPKIKIAVIAAAGTVAAAMISLAIAQPAMASGPSMHIVEGPEMTIPAASGAFAGNQAATAECPEGEFLTGGGANVTSGNSYTQRFNLAASKPVSNRMWWAYATNTDPSATGKLRAYAICAKMTSISVVQTP